ncbi:alpha-amylase family glycosyl hydrolase [Nonomuraea salmonea]|uniref:alpha-amylase family glycosyl hydrolase n=1 Tax=Nonomuraea salmonea TaxID=46181 RepID=UPI002FED39BC
MRLTYTSDVWWKNAVVYCLDVETFKDGNDDGVGDFRGLTQHIDYLAGLGVTCLWLMPFFPTPPTRTTVTTSPTSTRSIPGSARWATSWSSCARRTTGACA